MFYIQVTFLFHWINSTKYIFGSLISNNNISNAVTRQVFIFVNCLWWCPFNKSVYNNMSAFLFYFWLCVEAVFLTVTILVCSFAWNLKHWKVSAHSWFNSMWKNLVSIFMLPNGDACSHRVVRLSVLPGKPGGIYQLHTVHNLKWEKKEST